jgi:hypothetical protein
MKAITITLVSIWWSLYNVSLAQNQFPSQVWHKGRIITTDGQEFQGFIKYDLENNLVQLNRDGLDAFGASNIEQFEIFDEVYGGVRTFYSLPYALSSNYETPIFFEVLTQGNNLALLCREFIATDNRGMAMQGAMMMNPMWGPPMMSGYRLAFNFYFFKDGSIKKYSMKKRDLLNIFKDKSEEVQLFMRKNRLAHDKRGDLLRITAYYNQIKQ